MPHRPCTRCKGTKTLTSYMSEVLGPCRICKGVGSFTPPDPDHILREIFTKSGAGTLKKSYPSKGAFQDSHKARAYYVWRLAYFYGGKDVSMPMTADLVTEGDPWKPELNLMAQLVATQAFGTATGAATQWAKVLGANHASPNLSRKPETLS